ncbi:MULTISPECIES: TlpA disulfide reductase family protein [Kordiimonas]|jgi:thiol-disulfide isomerase/thioredoxin|uniref:TlpA disulfide reductase family protein n=1 Tax=Kordiimonas TaxID=288021 RepID=UPI00257ACEFE|nr:TlpA disulfide reductase family protein [Kordiimonas sp. UBA4487]
MKRLNALTVGGLLAVAVSLGAGAKEQPVDRYLTGDLEGMHAFDASLDLSGYQVVTGFDGQDKQVEKLSAKKGKTLLITFWDRSCLICRSYLKDLDELQRQMGDDKFEVVAIDIGRNTFSYTENSFKRWGVSSLKPYGSHHNGIVNEVKANPMFRFYGKEPKSLLVDGSGKVRAYSSVTRDWLSDEGKALIDALKKGEL